MFISKMTMACKVVGSPLVRAVNLMDNKKDKEEDAYFQKVKTEA